MYLTPLSKSLLAKVQKAFHTFVRLGLLNVRYVHSCFLRLVFSRSLNLYLYLFMPHISMDTVIDLHICSMQVVLFFNAHFLHVSHTLNYFHPILSAQQQAPLDWRIWVIWTTKGLRGTGAPSESTTQLGAQAMTPKVLSGFTSGYFFHSVGCRSTNNRSVNPSPRLLRMHKAIHSQTAWTLPSHCVQGDWCHSSKQT